MNKFNFGKKAMVLCAALALGFLASTASATCAETDSCFDSIDRISIGGDAWKGGLGIGTFTGDEGEVKLTESGMTSIDIKLDQAGNNCGVDCREGSFAFTGVAKQEVGSEGHSLGRQSGELVDLQTEGLSAGEVTFTFARDLQQ